MSRPTWTWVLNRWNWRKRRRVRAEIVALKALVVPIEQIDVPMSSRVSRVANLFERLGLSTVLDLGYGMGEALVVANQRAPDRIDPLILALDRFDDQEILGAGDVTERLLSAVSCRNELLKAVRDVLHEWPKSERPPWW